MTSSFFFNIQLGFKNVNTIIIFVISSNFILYLLCIYNKKLSFLLFHIICIIFSLYPYNPSLKSNIFPIKKEHPRLQEHSFLHLSIFYLHHHLEHQHHQRHRHDRPKCRQHIDRARIPGIISIHLTHLRNCRSSRCNDRQKYDQKDLLPICIPSNQSTDLQDQKCNKRKIRSDALTQ